MNAAAEHSPAAAVVRVPCSTSNLGAGFDCVGLALDRYLEARYSPGPAPLRLERAGTLSELDAPSADDLLVRAFRDRLGAIGVGSGGTLRVESEIPLARGLGSSAAAIVAGLALADAAAGRAFDAESALADALAYEPHPDNLAPALLGGLVAAVPAIGATDAGATRGGATHRLVRLPLSRDIGFAYAAPRARLSTAAARAALPATVPHATAVRSAARAIALARGLELADPDLIASAFDDELHVPYRMPLIEQAAAARAAAMDAGAWAVTVSGGGSGLIAVSEPATAARVAGAMRDAFGGTDAGAIGFVATPDLDGVRVLAGQGDAPGGSHSVESNRKQAW